MIISRVYKLSLNFILVTVIACLLKGWSRLLWTALSLQLPRTDGVFTRILYQLLPAQTLLVGPAIIVNITRFRGGKRGWYSRKVLDIVAYSRSDVLISR